MTKKQKIEVGQVWQANDTTLEVIEVSPAWATVRMKLDDTIASMRKGHLRDNWTMIGWNNLLEIETPADPEVMLEYEPDEADPGPRIAMEQAILAFEAQTGATLKESDIWLVMSNFYVIVERMKLKGLCEFLAMYKQCMNEESRGAE